MTDTHAMILLLEVGVIALAHLLGAFRK